MSATDRRIGGEAPVTHRGLTLLVLSAAQFVVSLDFSIVNVALPEIQKAFGLSSSDVPWVVTAYSVTFGGLLLVGGRMSDAYGCRRVFLCGLAILAIASAGGGLALSAPLLVAARALQGMGAALAAPAALAFISSLFEEGPERDRAFGVYGAALSCGFVTGVTAGGVLTTLLGWRAVMFASLVAAASLFVAGARVLPRNRRPVEGQRLHFAGGLAATGSVMAFIYAIARSEVAGWGSPEVRGFALTSLVLAALFVLVERRSGAPLVPVRVIQRPTLAGGSAVAALAGASAAGAVVLMALYSEEVLDYSPAQTGLLFATLGIAAIIASLIAPHVVEAIGLPHTLTLAIATQTAGLLVLFLISVDGGLPVVAAGLILLGFGHVATIIGCTTLATEDLAESEHGVASGVLNAAWEIGSGVGAVVLGTVAAAKLDQLLPSDPGNVAVSEAAVTESYGFALLAGAAFGCVAVLICAVALIRGSWATRTFRATHC